MLIKRMLVVAVNLLAVGTTELYAAHYIYLKNSLFGTPSNTLQQTGGAQVQNASLKKISDGVQSYDDYPVSIKPGAITWAVSTPTLQDNCTDTATCQMWQLAFDIMPLATGELGVKAVEMEPIQLAPADDIELVYTRPTLENPDTYYGYIVYTGGDRFESQNDTNSGVPSPIIPLVRVGSTTKFPVHTKKSQEIQTPPADQIAPAPETSLNPPVTQI